MLHVEDHTECHFCQLRLQFTHDHQDWTTADGKSLPGLINLCMVGSQFGIKQHGSLDPCCLVSALQAAGALMVWGYFHGEPWTSLLQPAEHHLNKYFKVFSVTISISL